MQLRTSGTRGFRAALGDTLRLDDGVGSALVLNDALHCPSSAAVPRAYVWLGFLLIDEVENFASLLEGQPRPLRFRRNFRAPTSGCTICLELALAR